MIILTTLKQKDLSAVSAQQLLLNPNYQPDFQPIQIEKFQLYNITGTYSSPDILDAIESSYIFSNPNKHHLITTSNDRLHENFIYFNVSRKSPLNLNSKVIQLNKLLPQDQSVSAVHMSDLWALKYKSSQNFSDEFIHHVQDNFIVSSPTNSAPFAHPLIHTVSPILHMKLISYLNEA